MGKEFLNGTINSVLRGMNEHLESAFDLFRRRATGGRWRRWFHRPLGYPGALLHAYFLYPLFKRKWEVHTATFWGADMLLPLPAGLDLYLAGGKVHDSEIRLARWMIRHVSSGDTALDIGAHLGYYTLLLSACTHGKGKIFAFEPGREIRPYLLANTQNRAHVKVFPFAVSDRVKIHSYRSHAMDKSESNRLVHAAEGDTITKNGEGALQTYDVEAVSLDKWLERNPCSPSVIKIDVEGSEREVLQGGENLMRKFRPVVIMEFHGGKSVRSGYLQAAKFMQALGYQTNEILVDGTARQIRDLQNWAEKLSLESDNLVFTPRSG